MRTVHEAHDLTPETASRAYPVQLRGVVTFYDPTNDPEHISLFLHDTTGGIFVSVPHSTPLATPAGTLLRVDGVTGVGRYAPVILLPRLTILGSAPLPPAMPVTNAVLLSGAADGQWVEARGVVRSVFKDEHDVTLQLAMADGVIGATAPLEPAVDYEALIDSTVSIRANAAPLFNDALQMIGARLLFPGVAVIRVLEKPGTDAFARPVVAIESLSRFNPLGTSPHRVHLRGRVTLQWPGSLLCIRDATRGLCANTLQTDPLPLNALVDLVGFPATGNGVPILTGTLFRRTDNTPGPPQSSVVSFSTLRVINDADLVRLEGELIGTSLSASETTLLLANGDFLFTAILPRELKEEAIVWSRGSRLLVTGICSALIDTEKSARATGTVIPKSFRILLRSEADVVVLRHPSWWSPKHALWIVLVVLSLTVLVLGWVVVLRKRVQHQTVMIRQSEERFRHLALHDALTGLPGRMLWDQRLNEALRTRDCAGKLALLMLDIDDFKSINDTHGHHAGDEALCVTAQRLILAVRKTDTVARMGGDEFVVLLNQVSEAQATTIAAKIVDTLSQPFEVNGREIPITVSVGLCKIDAGVSAPETILKQVDLAMYQAKARGKNCFHTFNPDLQPQLETAALTSA